MLAYRARTLAFYLLVTLWEDKLFLTAMNHFVANAPGRECASGLVLLPCASCAISPICTGVRLAKEQEQTQLYILSGLEA
jgi:hypothetical protein